MFAVGVIFAAGASCGAVVTIICRPSIICRSRSSVGHRARKGGHADVKCWQIIATGPRKSHMKRECHRLAGKSDGELTTYDMCGDCSGK
jgi:hypothetical protein